MFVINRILKLNQGSYFFVFLFFCFLNLFFLGSSHAETTISSNITEDTTWTLEGSPYIVTSSISIIGTDGEDGITTLEIEPGVEIKFNTNIIITIGSGSESGPGAMKAVGTEAEPILFTSNETNFWYGIKFQKYTDDETSIMHYCIIEKAKYSKGAVYAYYSSPTIKNCIFRNNTTYGIYSNYSFSEMTGNTFSGNGKYDIYSTNSGGIISGNTINSGIYATSSSISELKDNIINYNNSFPVTLPVDYIGEFVSYNTINNVTEDSYLISPGGTITRDSTWNNKVKYKVTASITIQGTDGDDSITTLTIEPGSELYFNANRFLTIGSSSETGPGAIKAVGTEAEPILFTSNEANFWYGVKFQKYTDDETSIMDHCIIEKSKYSKGAVYVYYSSPTIKNCIIRNNTIYGIYSSYSSPELIGNTFSDNGNYDIYSTNSGGIISGNTINSGIYATSSSISEIKDNIVYYNDSFPITLPADYVGEFVSYNTINNVTEDSYLIAPGGTITRDSTWNNKIKYKVTASITIQGTDGGDSITTLTIEPGSKLYFNANLFLTIGSSSESGPGAIKAVGTEAEPILFSSNETNLWYGIKFQKYTDDETSIMDHCIIEKAKYSKGAVYVYYSSPTIKNCIIRNNTNSGIYCNYSSPELTGNTFSDNKYGIYVYGGSDPTICRNNFITNTDYGLYSLVSTQLNAQNNWWSSDQGPNQDGDQIYGNIEFTPYLLAESSNIIVPNNPSGSIPENGSTNIILSQNYKKLDLVWDGGVQNSCGSVDNIHYKIMFGTSEENLQLIASLDSISSYQVIDLIDGTTYYWQIISETEDNQVATGPVWNFSLSNYKPVITLIGDNPVILTVDDSYSDQGATALDEEDGEITTKITVTNNVNLAEVGEYQISYNVSDSSGNFSDLVIRTVIVNHKFDDIDNDDLPDSWEIEYFGNLDNSSNHQIRKIP